MGGVGWRGGGGSKRARSELGICILRRDDNIFCCKMCLCLFQSGKLEAENSVGNREAMAQFGSELNINSRLPPELISTIFDFLPIADLHNALLVCRWT